MKHAESYSDCVPADGPDDAAIQSIQTDLLDDPVMLSIAMTKDPIIANLVHLIVSETHGRLRTVRGGLTWDDCDTLDSYRGLAIRLEAAVYDYACAEAMGHHL